MEIGKRSNLEIIKEFLLLNLWENLETNYLYSGKVTRRVGHFVLAAWLLKHTNFLLQGRRFSGQETIDVTKF